ncbi:MAG: GntR family transcriptional regulator [Sphaerochaetaceae bacterium]|nr:GntR family transcriptional regulator [Sphaerochaetaceae bacterium]MDC7236815.1 GntR family transcriptional regulator [Sphaerochaetaceae bacterium]MDC7243109.1 GntR family transcriptional regulator [Sphaerochaetaceae bacterium]
MAKTNNENEKQSAIVAHKIIEYIRTNNINPGDKLPSEKELSTLFNTGRTSVREAINRLSSIGLLTAIQGRGIILNEISIEKFFKAFLTNGLSDFLLLEPQDVKNLGELRLLLEIYSCKKYLSGETNKDITEMSDILITMRDCMYSGDLRAFLKADYEFHKFIVSLSNNEIICQIYKIIRTPSLREVEMVLTEGNIPVIQKGHEKIYKYLVDKDIEVLHELQKHLKYLNEDNLFLQ